MLLVVYIIKGMHLNSLDEYVQVIQYSDVCYLKRTIENITW